MGFPLAAPPVRVRLGILLALVLLPGCFNTRITQGSYSKARLAGVEVLVDGRLVGSGCLVDAQGTMITCSHVVLPGAGTIEVQSDALGRVPANILARDPEHDLLLLSLPRRAHPYPHLKVAVTSPIVGQEVWLFGAPVFRHATTLPGIIARSEPSFEFYDGAFHEILCIAAMAPGGTSGGAWINDRGEVIGVQSAVLSINNSPQGIAFSVPLPAVHALLKSRVDMRATTLNAGVEELWGQSADFIAKLPTGMRGLVVRQLQAGGHADQAGLQEWDIITRVNDQLIERTDEFLRFMRELAPGDTIEVLAADRNGQNSRLLTIELGSL